MAGVVGAVSVYCRNTDEEKGDGLQIKNESRSQILTIAHAFQIPALFLDIHFISARFNKQAITFREYLYYKETQLVNQWYLTTE